ncbi:MAG: pilin [Parasporobacterium sp.]|nr:pilin [Parasporobacterium sp.]
MLILRKSDSRKFNKGFTLAELLIVVGIIIVLAAVAIPTFVNLTEKAKLKQCQDNIHNINLELNAVILSYRDHVKARDAVNQEWAAISHEYLCDGQAVYAIDVDAENKVVQAYCRVHDWGETPSHRDYVGANELTFNEMKQVYQAARAAGLEKTVRYDASGKYNGTMDGVCATSNGKNKNATNQINSLFNQYGVSFKTGAVKGWQCWLGIPNSAYDKFFFYDQPYDQIMKAGRITKQYSVCFVPGSGYYTGYTKTTNPGSQYDENGNFVDEWLDTDYDKSPRYDTFEDAVKALRTKYPDAFPEIKID